MYTFVISSMSLIVVGLIGTGLAAELKPSLFEKGGYGSWFRHGLVANFVVFIGGMLALALLGVQDAMATAVAAEAAGAIPEHQASVGLGFEMLAVSLPTAISTISAGIAVSQIGSASLAVLAEKPEMFGRALIFLGLAEGLAIYGLVLSILLIGKL